MPMTGGETAASLGAQGLGDVGAGGAAGLGGAAAEAIPYLGALYGIGTTIAGKDPDIVKALDSLSYATAPFTFGITALIPTIMHALGLQKWFGPSEAWQTFGQRIGGGIHEYTPLGQKFLTSLQGANTEADVGAAAETWRQDIQSGGTHTGGWKGIGDFATPGTYGAYGTDAARAGRDDPGYGDPSSPYRIPMLPGAGGKEHEGGITWDSGPMVQALRDAVGQTLERVRGQPTPTEAPAPAGPSATTPEPSPSMFGGGPAGALGFSREMLEAA